MFEMEVIMGIWIEKGPGFLIPGFVPDPLGEIYEYVPNALKFMVAFGIWAMGFLIFTLLLKVAIPIITGKFRYSKFEREATPSGGLIIFSVFKNLCRFSAQNGQIEVHSSY